MLPDVYQPADTHPDRDTSYPVFMAGEFELPDGFRVGKVLHQFRENPEKEGFDAILCVYFPASCGEKVLELHRKHLTVEFGNWIKTAYRELKQ